MAIRRSCLPFLVKDPAQRLLILIVGKGEFTEALLSALAYKNKNDYGDKIQFSFCEDIEEILSCSEENVNIPDYIALLLDPTNNSCLQIAEENIHKADPTFISAGRLCLVNGSCSTKLSSMHVGFGHINVLAQKYSAILINGDVLIPDKCLNLASRILTLATSVCGYCTGIPIVLDIPGYDQMST